MAKKPKDPAAIIDPFASREAENYENPIPSREYILDYMEQTGEPVSYESLCAHLGLNSEDQAEALRRRLIAMARDGQLISNRRGVYGLVNRMELTKGRVQGNVFYTQIEMAAGAEVNGSLTHVVDANQAKARQPDPGPEVTATAAKLKTAASSKLD